MSTDNLDPEFQKGKSSVEHRNIDAAGEDHPFGDEAKDFTANLRTLIRKVADDLYDSWEATVREYLANAETATLRVERFLEDPSSSYYDEMIVDDSYQPKIEVTWNRREDSLVIKDNGIGMASQEVDEIFRKIGHSVARDVGSMSGQFGMGALSFCKFVGTDNSMIMISHSRLNDDNAAYLVSLAGVEPIMGSLEDDEYGTKFQLTPKEDMDIRQAVERYAEYQRVPVLYKEYDESGEEVFNEDWGDKSLDDNYDDDSLTIIEKEPEAFEAYCSPDASGKTLLLSMDIDRNCQMRNLDTSPPFSVDIRFLDEGGKIIKSSNGNEGMMPCPRSDYEDMLIEARDPYITEEMLNSRDVVGYDVGGKTAIRSDILKSDTPLPVDDYVPLESVDGDLLGEGKVIIGPHQGKTVVDSDEWDTMDEGRASLYVPEDDIEDYNVETGEGDLALPEPTSDRDRLQEEKVFWYYLATRFADKFDKAANEIKDMLDACSTEEERIEVVENIDPQQFLTIE